MLSNVWCLCDYMGELAAECVRAHCGACVHKVLYVSLWLRELLPGQQCINHGFYRVAGYDSLLLDPQTSYMVL